MQKLFSFNERSSHLKEETSSSSSSCVSMDKMREDGGYELQGVSRRKTPSSDQPSVSSAGHPSQSADTATSRERCEGVRWPYIITGQGRAR